MTVNTLEIYERRVEQYEEQIRALDDRSRRLSIARGLAFLLGCAATVCSYFLVETTPPVVVVGVLSSVPFMLLVVYHETVCLRIVELRARKKINQGLVARKQRRWADLRLTQTRVPKTHSAIAEDLDLFGRASVFHLLCQANTPRGIATLRDWVLNPADPEEISRRQAAVQELASEVDLREELGLRGRLLNITKYGPNEFVAWAESQPWLKRRPWLIWLPRLSLLVSACLVVALLSGMNPAVVACSLIGTIVFNVILSVLYTGAMHDIFDTVSSTSRQVAQYCAIFELLRGMPSTSEKLSRARQDMASEEQDALHSLRHLQKIMILPNIRHSALTMIPLYLPLQVLAGWDFHCLWLIEGWRKKHGGHVRTWFDALGEFEALASLSSLAHDHPDWCYAEVDTSLDRFVATELAHPLLPDDVRVTNDVSVGPGGRFLLVTGSNMSGKSTLLRSLGINLALAQMGSVVCSKSLRTLPVRVTTSIHVWDSLKEGVSFYMAELKRLKRIVDEAAEFESRDDRCLFFLLDELLQGTNSRERHIAVERVVSHLVAHGAIGAATTHDLDLASGETLRDACQVVHFRETVNEDAVQPMTFDYKMHDGVATTTNALKLLEMVGLPTDVPPSAG